MRDQSGALLLGSLETDERNETCTDAVLGHGGLPFPYQLFSLDESFLACGEESVFAIDTRGSDEQFMASGGSDDWTSGSAAL